MKEQLHINFTGIIINLITNYWYLWLALIAFAPLKNFFKSNTFKGWLGEQKVRMLHWKHLNKKIYHTFNNIYLQLNDGRTAQIDHIIVSIYGIFVTETKNINGTIIGKDYEDKWTQVLNNQKEEFPNPIHQNEKHIENIAKIRKIPENKFHSIIMFVGDDCKFEHKMPDNVLQKGYIKYIKSRTEKILTGKEVANIIEGITAYRLPNTFKTRKKHIEYVSEIKNRNGGHTPKKITQ